MPVPVPSCASVIPLDYGSHIEFSIMLVDQWSELSKLLADPVTYMAGRQPDWNQAPAPPAPPPPVPRGPFPLPRPPGPGPVAMGPIPWTLQRPVTVEIRPINERPDLAPVVLSMLANTPYGVVNPQFSDAEWQATLFGLWETDFPGGMFVAEFAAATAMLQIGYLPPWIWQGQTYHRLTPPLAAAAPGKPTVVPMDFTPPTIGYLGLQATSLRGVIHQDLQAPAGHPEMVPNAQDRANLIVDLLGNRDWYVAWLNTHGSLALDYALVTKGIPKTTIDLAPSKVVPIGGIVPEIVIAYPLGSTQPAPQSDLPTVTAQVGELTPSPMDACYTTLLLDARFLKKPLKAPVKPSPFRPVLGNIDVKIYYPLPGLVRGTPNG